MATEPTTDKSKMRSYRLSPNDLRRLEFLAAAWSEPIEPSDTDVLRHCMQLAEEGLSRAERSRAKKILENRGIPAI